MQPHLALALILAANSAQEDATAPANFEPLDVFGLEYASDPRITPGGSTIVYVRNFMDVMTDRRRSNLWTVDFDGGRHRPLTTGNANHSSPRWSPTGDRLLYISSEEGSSQIYVRWMDTGQTAKLSNLTEGPRAVTWSADGEWIAFTMRVPEEVKPFATMPNKPEGAEWAPAAKVITKLRYRADGAGYLKDGYQQIFVLPATGGTPRALTSGSYDHGGPLSWTPDGAAILFSANRHPDGEYDPMNSEVYAVSVADGSVAVLTDRQGPDRNPVVSPDGDWIAYVGFDDRLQGYQVPSIELMRVDGSDRRSLTSDLDRSPGNLIWSQDGDGLFFSYDDRGGTVLAYAPLEGERRVLAEGIGGTTLGRPYTSGSFDVAKDGRFVLTHTTAERPADIAAGQAQGGAPLRVLTALNEDLLAHKRVAAVEEFWVPSSFDERPIQCWLAKPPGFDPAQRYPLVLEIHGGPFANYGPRFSAEVQLYAAAGYVVLYTNPRGSTSYGEEFGNLIHHNYPGEDYDDLMSAVDAVLARGVVADDRLYVTGGSGGGVLTSWIVGKTDRFRAAVVAKPVINWTSFALTADAYNFFYKYWFPGFPWEHQDQYFARSPLSLVGNVTTPTMLLTGEEDYRTPISESEQYYQALKLLRVDTALVRIPEASHGIVARPSNLIAKIAHVLRWFESHGDDEAADVGGALDQDKSGG